MSPEEDRTRDAVDSEPKHYQLSYSGHPGTGIDPRLSPADRLVGLVVKASASRAEDPGFESRLQRDFSGVESYQ